MPVLQDLATLAEGDFFGEMALLRAEPRAATVTAAGHLKCLTLARITFTRLLGPLQVSPPKPPCHRPPPHRPLRHRRQVLLACRFRRHHIHRHY